jgi:hypothetical protein
VNEALKMNRHEHRYRRSGGALIVLLGLWVAAMLLAWALPASVWKTRAAPLIFFGGIFPILLAAAIVLGVMRMVAYIRWTGKYPYYFLFGKAHGSGDDMKKEEEGSRPENGSSA